MLISTEEPWTSEQIENAYFADFQGTSKDIESTEGGLLWAELEALHCCLFVFTSCVNDLLDIISDFAHETTKNNFWARINEIKQDEYSNKVRKNIFCSAAAAMALVDHARRFFDKYPVCLYKEKIIESFGGSGIHDFVQGLRNYIVHVKIAEANWQINYDFVNGKREVKFLIKTDSLLEYKMWNSKAKSYINENYPHIDVYKIYLSYLEKVEKFHQWHKSKVISQYSECISRYFKYKKCLNKLKNKISWNLIFQQIQNVDDPYVYLSQYLSSIQLEEILSYEYKSKEQIDRVIEIIDINKACDDSLREKAHLLIMKSNKA